MSRWATGMAVVIVLAMPLAAQDKAAGAVNKAITAHGGLDVLKKYPGGTSHIAGKVIIGSAETPFTGSLAFLIPGKARVEMTFEVLGKKGTTVQTVNGEKVQQTDNGVVTKLDNAAKAELRESAVIQEISLLYPLLDPAKYTLKSDPDTTIDGRECAVVVAKAKGLKDTVLYFDKKTWYLAAMRRKGLSPMLKEVDELTTFSDYKTIAGMVVPMKSKVAHDGRPFLEITVSDYKPLEKVDEKLFAVE